MIIRELLIFLEIIVAYLFQTSVFSDFQMAGVVPDCLIILVCAVAYMRGRIPGTVVGFISGILIDMTYGNIIGLFAFMYSTIGYICGYANKIYDSEDYTLPYIMIGVSEFLYNFMYYVLFKLMEGKLNIWWYMVKYMFPKVIYTVFISIIIYRLYNAQHKYFENRSIKNTTKKERNNKEGNTLSDR